MPEIAGFGPVGKSESEKVRVSVGFLLRGGNGNPGGEGLDIVVLCGCWLKPTRSLHPKQYLQQGAVASHLLRNGNVSSCVSLRAYSRLCSCSSLRRSCSP